MLSEREHGSPSAVSWGLNPCSNAICSQSEERLIINLVFSGVLILVLMEDALRDSFSENNVPMIHGLNPCSNGRCSQRLNNYE